MSQESKSTVTVYFEWYSSNPTFDEVLTAVKREMSEKRDLCDEHIEVLEELLPLNEGRPFIGRSQFGLQTCVWFEAPSLSKAVQASEALEYFLRREFGRTSGFFNGAFQSMDFRYGGRRLTEVLESLETALSEVQQDLKSTRRFVPSKKIQHLRKVYKRLYK